MVAHINYAVSTNEIYSVINFISFYRSIAFKIFKIFLGTHCVDITCCVSVHSAVHMSYCILKEQPIQF